MQSCGNEVKMLGVQKSGTEEEPIRWRKTREAMLPGGGGRGGTGAEGRLSPRRSVVRLSSCCHIDPASSSEKASQWELDLSPCFAASVDHSPLVW